MAKILVTGAAGFLGQRFVEYLKNKSKDVLIVNRGHGDIRDEQLFDQFANEDISHVYHLAGATFVPESWDEPRKYFDVNVKGTLNCLEFCREKNISMTFISSYIYSNRVKLPTDEDSEKEPQNPYGLSKSIAEELCMYYSKWFEINIQVVRPFNIFGENQPSNFIIPRIIAVASGTDKKPLGNLNVYRDFVHVSDVCSALYLVRESKGFQVFNVGSGKATLLADLFIGGDKNLSDSSDMHRKNEIIKTQANISKLSKLGWSPKYSVLEFVQNEIKN